MTKETEVIGINTIRGLVGEPPRKVKVPYNVIYKQQLLLQAWNSIYIAVLPYCFKCKEPLVWHNNPQNNVLFHCPKCNRRWVKEEGWNKKDE